jgi:hypothetical protein
VIEAATAARVIDAIARRIRSRTYDRRRSMPRHRVSDRGDPATDSAADLRSCPIVAAHRVEHRGQSVDASTRLVARHASRNTRVEEELNRHVKSDEAKRSAAPLSI